MRIPVTLLESFHLHLIHDWLSEADLLASIRRDAPSSPAMKIGHSFDAVLSDAARYRVPGGYICDGYQWGDETMALAFATLDPRTVWQVKTTKPFGDHTVVGKADGVLGSRLIENKTTLGAFDFERYERSFQWRFYLDLFDAREIEYHVFRLDDHENGVVEVRDIETFTLYPYPKMHADCVELLNRFVEFVQRRRLELYLEEPATSVTP